MTSPSAIGVVVIGRNEGDRLKRCFASLGVLQARTVYVDSGSTDGSVAWAQAQGVTVVELDRDVPFTAARARNVGVERLPEDCRWVQFVDGDCEVQPAWIAAAHAFMVRNKQVAAACGRRRERFPEASVYNRLCDLEWDTPVGRANACGGDALFDLEALRSVGGYRADLIAGEEPELCARLRAAGKEIHRIDAEMTLHDAAMTRWGQWWRRAVRAGHAYAEVSRTTDIWRRDVRSAIVWAALVPLLALGLAWPTHGWSLLLLGLYPVLFLRIAARAAQRWGLGNGLKYAAFCLLAKWAHLQGIATYWFRRWRRGPVRLIEYKQPAAEVAGARP